MNIIEEYRKIAVNTLWTTSFGEQFQILKPQIEPFIKNGTEKEIFDLGDHLSEIFQSPGQKGRSQSSLSKVGTQWECMIAWYLNLCLTGRRTVAIKSKKNLIPKPIYDCLGVMYDNFRSNSESDIIVITFPDLPEYTEDASMVKITDDLGKEIKVYKQGKNGVVFNTQKVMDALVAKHFDQIEVHIIQCKTNWNDNAQIPMLWDILYNAGSLGNGATVGCNGYSIKNLRRFTYSFATIPTNNADRIKQNSTCVQRVRNLSGGNYWGRPTKTGIASSIKEALTRNMSSGSSESFFTTIKNSLPKYKTDYEYLRLRS